MVFTFESAIEAVKLGLEAKDKKRSADLRMAMQAALNDLSMRLRSESFITSYSVSVSSGDREVTLTGDNNDLQAIFAITVGDGSDYRALEYDAPHEFIRESNDPEAGAGLPERFTILKSSSSGFPIVRFNQPFESDETLTVYYYYDITPDNIHISRSISAVVYGTKAYFFGLETEAGAACYQNFRQLAALARASDSFTPESPKEFRLPYQQRQIMESARTMKRRRN